jgi:hypothetical protein
MPKAHVQIAYFHGSATVEGMSQCVRKANEFMSKLGAEDVINVETNFCTERARTTEMVITVAYYDVEG